MSYYLLNERDLLAVADYRRFISEELTKTFGEETYSFSTYTAQAPYLHLDHSIVANFRISEGKAVFSTVEELDRSISEGNLARQSKSSYQDWAGELQAKLALLKDD